MLLIVNLRRILLPWSILAVILASSLFDSRTEAQTTQGGSINIGGNVGRDVIIINGGSTDNIPQQHEGEGARWIRASGTVDVLGGVVSITVPKIYEHRRAHVADLRIKIPLRKDYKGRHLKENDYMDFEYKETNYRVDILDVKLDDQKILLRVKRS